MKNSFRMGRIEKLINELMYELERGFMESEIEETINFRHIVPISREIPGGMVLCSFSTRPVHYESVLGLKSSKPFKFSLVKNTK